MDNSLPRDRQRRCNRRRVHGTGPGASTMSEWDRLILVISGWGTIITGREWTRRHALRMAGVRLAKFTMFMFMRSNHHLLDASQRLFVKFRSILLQWRHHRLWNHSNSIKSIIISAKWPKWMAEIMRSFDVRVSVCVCAADHSIRPV